MRHLLRQDQLEAHEDAWAEAFEAQARASEEVRAAQRAADQAAGFLVGGYEPEVVGESHLQPAIARWVPAAADTRAGISVILELVPDLKNQYS